MARGIVVTFSGETSTFAITKIEREKLYGKKERIAVDEKGVSCQTAWLTRDGVALVPSGGTAYVYVDEAYETVERKEMVCVAADGAPLPLVKSTLGVPQEARAVPPDRVLDHVATSVYALATEDLGAETRAALDAGAVLEFRFNWRDDYADAPAFLLRGEEGYFALVSEEARFEFMTRAAPPPELEGEEGGDEEDADLDFTMM